MEIKLYITSSPNNALQKNLASTITLEGALRAESSVINPVIRIEAENLSRYNYMYISEFGRCYFINDVISLRTGLWELHAHVDVLGTYRTQLLDHMAIIDKQQNAVHSQLLLDDGDWVTKNQKYITIKNFQHGLLSDGEYILITAGAVGAEGG